MVLGSRTEKWTKMNEKLSEKRLTGEREKDGNPVLALKRELLWHRTTR